MGLSPRTLRPANNFTPRSIAGLALWLDASSPETLFTTDAGAVTAVSAPTEIAGCVLWLDGADSSAASMTLNGSLVETWKDKSNSGNNATATSTARPTLTSGGLNGKSVVTFDGTANAMQIAANAAFNSNDLTYFVVFKQAAAANKGVYTKLNANAGTNGFGLAVRSDPQIWLLQKNAGASQVLTSTANPTTQARIYTVTSSATAAGYLDGLSSATGASTADHSLSQRVMVGSRDSSEYLNGYVAEVIHYNRALTRSELAQVESMLAAKWGISGVHAPATATSDPVGAWLDKSGNARHATQSTAGSRPTISATATNGKRALAFNGTSSTLAIANYAGESGVSGLTRYMVMSQPTGAGFLTGTGGSGGNFFQQVSFEGRFFAGSAYRSVSMPLYSYLTAGTRILCSVYSGSAATVSDGIQPYGDGALLPQLATNGTLPTTLSGSASTYFLGSNLNANNFFNGRTLEVLTYNRALTSTERRRVEQYLATKYGITLAPQVANADAQDWINRVYANGGTVTSSTAAEVSTFCDAIDAAAIRDRFYRLNLFCGGTSGTTAGLAACLVPLYRGPSLGGTQYGGTTDTNVGPFVSGDYAETGASGGLAGNGSGKFLKTGLTTSALPQIATGHLSVYASTLPTAGIYGLITSWGSGFADPIYAIEANRNGAGQLVTSWGNNYPGVNISSGVGTGLLMTSRAGGTSLKAYRNGSQIGTTSTTSITPAANTGGGFGVFANAPQDGAGANWFPGRLAGYSIGAGMDDTQAAAFSTAMTAFQTALGRNV